MRRILLAASLVALALPLAAPQTTDAASCSSRKQTGTVIGGLGGALAGKLIGGGTTGLVVGGLGGAVAGHEIGRAGCKERRVARTTTYREVYRDPPPAPARKVYYDQYGKPVVVHER